MCQTTAVETLHAAATSGANWLANAEAAAKQLPEAQRTRIIFPRRKGGEDQHCARPVRVSRQMLDSLTHLPLPCACKRLGLCATTFKKACRRAGIMQWPYKRGRAANHDMHQEELVVKAESEEPVPPPAPVFVPNMVDQMQRDSMYSTEEFSSAPESPYSTASPQSSVFSIASTVSEDLPPSACLLEPASYAASEAEARCCEPESNAADFLDASFPSGGMYDLAFLSEDDGVSCFADEEQAPFLKMLGWDSAL
jgi:hypothetical protein